MQKRLTLTLRHSVKFILTVQFNQINSERIVDLEYKIKQIAKISGVTVRTLHYYDEIGLLKPKDTTDCGYRLYDEESLSALQQVLFFRELGFPLGEIKEIMKTPGYNKLEALKNHRELLIKKRDRLNGLIMLVENNIKGDDAMSFKEFDMSGIKAARKKYAVEVKQRWGNTKAFREEQDKTKAYDEKQWEMLCGEGADILKQFGECRYLSPDSKQAQQLVEKWQAYITDNFYSCNKQILSCLGLMYTNDERFTKNIDKNGEGTAEFMGEAIAVYCAN